jgi:hypothetical protein
MIITVDAETVLKPRVDVSVRRIGGTYTVGEESTAFGLSETGSFVWRALDGRRTAADVAALLADQYDIDASEALADTLDLLQGLVDLELLREFDRRASGA